MYLGIVAIPLKNWVIFFRILEQDTHPFNGNWWSAGEYPSPSKTKWEPITTDTSSSNDGRREKCVWIRTSRATNARRDEREGSGYGKSPGFKIWIIQESIRREIKNIKRRIRKKTTRKIRTREIRKGTYWKRSRGAKVRNLTSRETEIGAVSIETEIGAGIEKTRRRNAEIIRNSEIRND